MADCPLCEWRYDQYAACVWARPTREAMPVIYDGQQLRLARGSEAPNGRYSAAGAHICFEHPMEPEVLIFGPVEKWYPLAKFNAFVTALTGR